MSLIAIRDSEHGPSPPSGRRILAVSSGAHALHDGYADLLYLLLPVWRTEFALGYAEIGLMRALYVGVMAGFQVPAGFLGARLGVLRTVYLTEGLTLPPESWRCCRCRSRPPWPSFR